MCAWRVGADFRYRLTSNLTLSGTVNPDFGQVEVDPAVVNLSAFETFYDEKRPFFVEGARLFSFGGLSCFFCSNISSLSVFYSRRIGRAPQGASLPYDAGAYADVPTNSTILGAAKVTGRTADGTSVALLNAVTRRESAPVVMHWPERADDRLTRGGPVVRVPRGGHASLSLSTDERGPIVLGTNPNLTWRANGTRDYTVNLSLTYRPAPNVSVRVGPGFSHRESGTQYVGAWDDATAEAFGGRRYLFGAPADHIVQLKATYWMGR